MALSADSGFLPAAATTGQATSLALLPIRQEGRLAPVVVSHSFVCRANVCALWPIISDTDRINRLTGMKRVSLTPINDGTAARYRVRTWIDGFPMVYDELPGQWIENERYVIRRRMLSGPLRSLEMRFQLTPTSDGGTRVDYQLIIETRFRLLQPLAWLNGQRRLRSFERELQRIDGDLAKSQPLSWTSRKYPPDEAVLARAATTLVDVVPAEQRSICEQLISLVREGPDFDVTRIRPFGLADAWEVDRAATLSVCLSAVMAGLLEMSWELICPSCRTASTRSASLSEVPADGHCQLCDLGFGIDLDRAVEVTFRPAPGIRRVDEGPYCVGGPARTPHVITQVVIPAGATVAITVPDGPGQYRLFARGGMTARIEAVGGAAAEIRIPMSQEAGGELTVAPGGRILVVGDGLDDRHIKLEHLNWASQAATAHHVSLNPTFRKLFSKEVLKPGLTLRVARVALLFSDLTASTALYNREGDAFAFRMIIEHFDLLQQVIESHGGVIVKTIGDAIMASFLDDGAAVRAAVEMQRAFMRFVVGHVGAEDVQLKLGVFAGPCYAVTANGLLDYFGQTVNIAARLQGKAESGEIVLPQELAAQAQTADWLAGAQVSEPFEAELKGVSTPITCARLTLAASRVLPALPI